MGVNGIQVEEIWSLDFDFSSLDPVYGIIFLFKWDKEAQDSSKEIIDPNLESENSKDQDILFIKQVIPNSCATQAIVSVLINSENIELGENLSHFKEFVLPLPSDMRGLVLANHEQIKLAHNSFSKPNIFEADDDSKYSDSGQDAFHFVAYVPKNGCTFKLDGLQQSSQIVGKCESSDTSEYATHSWTKDAIADIKKKIDLAGPEIRFNLMALTRDCRISFSQRLDKIKADVESLRQTLANLHLNSPQVNNGSHENDSPALAQNHSLSAEEIQSNIDILLTEQFELQLKIEEHNKKLDSYRTENSRRKHNFIPLIYSLIEFLAKTKKLDDAINRASIKK
ncbi:hypothetical protein BB560_001492 [Smittium megazygosporum]|uniref:ubiquitinyl hydrolase 1 n=1 Tax=Smittium megazygosporum TaxID=133381 RepID=A0A2T9ZHD5_9FUNG|nr:hypothetical protein BB560_001492 [Smittium megazygosporum]